jgi:hypothetical protein
VDPINVDHIHLQSIAINAACIVRGVISDQLQRQGMPEPNPRRWTHKIEDHRGDCLGNIPSGWAVLENAYAYARRVYVIHGHYLDDPVRHYQNAQTMDQSEASLSERVRGSQWD